MSNFSDYIKSNLSDNFKHFFRFFELYEDSLWEKYSDILISEYEKPTFRFKDINEDFVNSLLLKCKLKNNLSNSSIVDELKYLTYIYFDEKNEDYLINEGKLQQTAVSSSAKRAMWSLRGELR